MSGRVDRLVEIADVHRRVHEALERKDLDPFHRAYLDGVEDVLDWLLERCPDGDRDWGTFSPEDGPGYEYKVCVIQGDPHDTLGPHIVATLAPARQDTK